MTNDLLSRRQQLAAGAASSLAMTVNPGRVHWPDCFSAIQAEARIRGRAVYGKSDKIGAYVKDRPVRPQDLAATIYHALGVPLDTSLSKDGTRRPITTGRPIKELFS